MTDDEKKPTGNPFVSARKELNNKALSKMESTFQKYVINKNKNDLKRSENIERAKEILTADALQSIINLKTDPTTDMSGSIAAEFISEAFADLLIPDIDFKIEYSILKSIGNFNRPTKFRIDKSGVLIPNDPKITNKSIAPCVAVIGSYDQAFVCYLTAENILYLQYQYNGDYVRERIHRTSHKMPAMSEMDAPAMPPIPEMIDLPPVPESWNYMARSTMTLSKDNRLLLISAFGFKSLTCIDLKSFKSRTVQVLKEYSKIEFQKGSTHFCALSDYSLEVYDTITWKPRVLYESSNGDKIESFSISPANGDIAIVVNNKIIILDSVGTATGKGVNLPELRMQHLNDNILFTPDGEKLILYNESSLRVFPNVGKITQGYVISAEHNEEITNVCVSHDSQKIHYLIRIVHKSKPPLTLKREPSRPRAIIDVPLKNFGVHSQNHRLGTTTIRTQPGDSSFQSGFKVHIPSGINKTHSMVCFDSIYSGMSKVLGNINNEMREGDFELYTTDGINFSLRSI